MKKAKKAVKSTRKSSPVRASRSSSEQPSVIIQMGVVFIIVASIALAWYMGMRMN